MRFRLLALIGAIAVLAVPAAAQAATKTVNMGPFGSVAKRLGDRYSADVNSFFPGTVTIHSGDSVRFVPNGFHSLDLPKRGARPTNAFLPTGTASENDAAGAPFWFNGQPKLGINPALLRSGFGKTFTYTGAKSVNSGLPLANRPKPMTVRFPRAGSYNFFCDVHPGMKGRVVVKARRASVPSARADAGTVRRALAQNEKTAKSLGGTSAPSNTVLAGVASPNGTELLRFLPDKLSVPVGTTVTFEMRRPQRDTHTATFGPGDPEKQASSYLGVIAHGFEGAVFDPRATYPSDPPSSTAVLTPTLHGNGFWNSGALDAVSGSPLPASSKVTFGQAGTYDFYCLIHPFMHGQVTVR